MLMSGNIFDLLGTDAVLRNMGDVVFVPIKTGQLFIHIKSIHAERIHILGLYLVTECPEISRTQHR